MRFSIPSTATLALPAVAAVVLAAAVSTLSEADRSSLAAGRTMTETKTYSQAELSDRYAKVRARMGALYASGASEQAVAAAITKDFGIVSLEGGRAKVPATVPVSVGANDVTLSKPTMMYDSETHNYVISARYVWKNNCSVLGDNTPCWAKDKSSNGGIGGVDGFALKVYPHKIVARDQGMTTYNNCGSLQWSTSQPSTRSPYGVAFELQDSVLDGSSAYCKNTRKRMNMDSGIITEAFVFEGNCTSAQVNVESYLAHSWNTTSLNSIGISLGRDSVGFSTSWSTTTNQWGIYPQYAYNGNC